jgi:rare lipoprotein A
MSVPGVEPRVCAGKRRWRGAASLGMSAFALAGCATQTPQVSYSHGHEHFAQSKYGHASPKLVADGQPVPRGGGQYLVGHPYSVAGHRYYPAEDPSYTAVGMASWYGAAFHGRRTANGEVYDMASLSAAHPTMPLPSYARVTNLGNGYSVIVRVNDRGPYHGGRVMDVSSRVAEVLDMKAMGTARVKVEYVGPAPIEGSDDSQLLASLRTDGSPASMIGYPAAAPIMVAAAETQTIFSFFSGRGAQQTPPSPPEPVQVATPPAPAPEPEPEPVRVAAVAEAPAAEAAPTPEAAPVAIRQPHGPVPLPPSRPFDLGSNRSNLVVASVATSERGVLPPRRPDLQASAEKAIYFSAQLPPKRPPAGAFDRLKSTAD